MPRVLISTITPISGGVPTMTRCVVATRRDRGYEPVWAHDEPYRLSPQLSVASDRLGRQRVGSERRQARDDFHLSPNFMSVVIQVENLSKYDRLGLIGGGTRREDLNRWWAKARGRPDPLLKIGDTDHGNRVGGELWALRDVSFQVREGEILGIIGRNGAGKSTLLKILSRITAPTSGQVKIKGRVGSLLEVGTGFHPELTGRENLYLNGAILGMKKAEIDRKLDEIIDFAEIEQFIDTPVKRYSSGMYVRHPGRPVAAVGLYAPPGRQGHPAPRA